MNDKHVNAYLQEAAEILVSLESALLALDEDHSNDQLVDEVFRALHTIKGGGSMFGFDTVASFVHETETIYDKIRDHELKVTDEIVDLTLKACDQIKLMLQEEDSSDKGIVNELLNSFRKILGSEQKGKEESQVKPVEDVKGERATFHIHFKPYEDLFLSGTNPVSLLKELAELGDSYICVDSTNMPDFENLNPEKIYVSWDVFLSTDKGINAIKDVFIFVDDDCVIDVKELHKGDFEGNAEYYKNLLTAPEQKEEPAAVTVEAPKEEQKEEKSTTSSNKASSPSQSVANVRVSSAKLDQLVNLVGELVTIQARLSQTASSKHDSALIDLAEDLETLSWELRETALSMRMLPIETTFSKFKRLVRDLSKDLDKKVELETSGGDTELDKNVIEKLGDPLVHIIRNSIDHGIEKPEERIKNGKDETGRIFLSAMHSGTHVFIKIEDDGKGLNRDLIYKKAVERGLITQGAELSDSEIFSLIFHPGFSTAQAVTNVSGRGVGMDVVQTAITSLRGSVEVDSYPGEGTSITLKLPLTLAIIEGLMVRIDKEYFVVPLSYVEECIEFNTALMQQTKNGRKLINFRNEIVPYIPLREKFSIVNNKPEIQQIIVINDSGKKTGLVVDEIIDKHQTVIKSLGKFYKNIEVMSGATVMGDGSVALIIDVPKLINSEINEEKLLVETL